MKKYLIYILLAITASNTFGQKITIEGIAIDSSDNRRIRITIKPSSKHIEDSITRINEDFYFQTEKNGYFKINVYPTDSLFFRCWNHITESYLASDLLKKENIVIKLKPEDCVQYIPCKEKSHELYVFIGKKIKVDYADYVNYCNIITMDTKYDAEYKILKNLYGNFPKDTIKFVSYDHASIKRYDEYETVLLYVAEYCGELIHVKYQYHPLYKTVKGKWASPYNPRDWRNIDSTANIEPRKIKFKKPIEFEFEQENLELIKKRYPEPYFQIKNGKIKVMYGNYPKELFKLKKMTTLPEFGFFE